MVPNDDHTSLVLECFCSRGDSIWQLTDDEIAHRCVADLANKLRFLDPDEVIGWDVVRTIQAYPVYDLSYRKKMGIVLDYLRQHEGIHVVGRGGTFRYNNADHSIEMGLMLARRLLGEQIDHMAVNTESEYQEVKLHSEPKRDHYRLSQDQ